MTLFFQSLKAAFLIGVFNPMKRVATVAHYPERFGDVFKS
jgi:hypothetical protein